MYNIKIKKNIKNLFVVFILIIAILFIGFNIYVNDYYKAEHTAIDILENADNLNIEIIDNLTILKGNSDTGIIFYPGAKVEAISYLPILQKLQQHGLTCVLIEMPYNMAIFDTNAGDDILKNLDNFDNLKNINNWYMAGHSMGGGMASSYASKNPNLIKGLLLMGAYVYGDYPPEKSLTIYGTHNSNLEENIDYTDNIIIIDGGNHAQFGNYGKQKGDPDADISPEEQQNITVDAIIEFINN